MEPVDNSSNSLPTPCSDATKHHVFYFYEPIIGDYYHHHSHPMRPRRVRMTHSLITSYNLYHGYKIFEPFPAKVEDMEKLHAPKYVDFLKSVTPGLFEGSKMDVVFQRMVRRFNVGGDDFPVFEGLFQFCQVSVGGNMGGAVAMNRGLADIVLNWASGLHHAYKEETSGFCYSNDIVLGILELLQAHKTAVAVGVEPEDKLPCNDYYEYFGPDYTLHYKTDEVENKNLPQDLEIIRNMLLEHLSKLQHAPSLQFQARPPDTKVPEEVIYLLAQTSM